MIEVRFHGRGGQGAVTSAELVALAAIEQGKFAQAFPNFGPERRGAPVMAFLRVDEKPIRLREKVYEPNIVVVLDPTVIRIAKVDDGLKDDGILVINSNRDVADLRAEYGFTQKLALVDATRIATEILGLPITNTVMLGALIKVSGLIDSEAINGPLARRFGSIAPKNQKAYERAFTETKLEE
ncbi:MAG: 2-oxoacid:acceptor oxidoreductase family protein [Deltaproteobacteria bacterium]|nr:2-oxoacid:acceptor oxidoreductase family protein [Deltaproteobacteria bacterium]MBW2051633.1 2-oxoacid:acceptor oxidoreductase family protein [Deltaproteobacteria bacterium]MBW2141588.1 2-oxoacid:acceptor oxidoreductase family protein [Deltaproteobacteria bacterium]MBW2323038.1 2-oxoacid:acceptor oxidoreductase family protein [Deltaproteobacteria bacterium]